MSKRRNFSAEFKAKVALEALVGDKTLSELAAKHDVHSNMITQWKRQAKEGLPEAFGKMASRGPRALFLSNRIASVRISWERWAAV